MVSKCLVMLVEIHPLQSQSGQQHWFQERHLQETVQIVKDAIDSRFIMASATAKSTQQNSAIITVNETRVRAENCQPWMGNNYPPTCHHGDQTWDPRGDSLRLGYVFKKRPSSQQCLVPVSCLTKEEQEELEEGDLHSLNVSKEKLIIYACQRQTGSPQSMSQLVRVLGEKTQSVSKGVSISSYFQKMSRQPKTQTVSRSSSPAISCVVPKSGGKRNILKKIIQKADSNVSNKRKKAVKTSTSNRDSPIHHFLHKGKDLHKEEDVESYKRSNTENKRITDNTEELSNDNNSHSCALIKKSATPARLDSKSEKAISDQIDNNHFIQSSVLAKDSPYLSHSKEGQETIMCQLQGTEVNQSGRGMNQLEDIIAGEAGVRISQVFNSPVPLSSEPGSVTLISVDQMQEIQQQKQKANQMRTESGQKISSADTRSSELSYDYLKPPFESEYLDVSVLPSASFVSHSDDDVQSRVLSNANIKHISDDSSIQQEKLTSPKVKSGYISDQVDSPVFCKKKCDKQQISSTDLEESGNSNAQEFSQSVNKVETPLLVSQNSVSNKENRKLKRKFPNFSDSETDDNELPLISRKPRPQNKAKFVRLDEMKQKTRKFSISKAFFTGRDEKAQPTLSSFMAGCKTNNKKREKEVASDSELSNGELENIDCSLIEELSFIANVKRETDVEIKREIKDLRDVSELNEEHLNFMVRHSEQYLRDIFEGKIHSSRHLAYKQGGKSKRDLNYGSCLKLYSEEQIDTIMEALMAIFCKRHHKYLDYIMKVLLPEMLIRFHMKIHNLTKEESEQKLLP